MSVLLEKPKLRVTVDNTDPPSDEIVFERIHFDEQDLDMLLPQNDVRINRPFSRPAPRKRYQNPDFYIAKKPDEPDENTSKKIEVISAEEKDLPAQEKLKRRQNRAKTFGMVWGEIITPESDLIQKYQSKTAEQKKSKARSTAIHLDGVTDLTTEQVFEYFKPHPPESLEWIDDDTCNIVYDKEKDCSLCFLQYLTPNYPEIHRVPAKNKDRKSSEDVAEETVKNDREDDEEEEGQIEDDNIEEVLKIADESIYVTEQKKTEVQDSSGNVTNIFRYGPVKIIDEKLIVLTCRYAVESDRKQADSMLKSRFYQQRGNPYFNNMTGVFTNSFKRRYLGHRSTGTQGFDDLPPKSAVFARLGTKPNQLATEVHSDIRHHRDEDDVSEEDGEDLDELLRAAADPLSDIDEPGKTSRRNRKLSRSRSPHKAAADLSDDSSVDSFDDMLMSMRSGRRMKLYADDIEEKSKKKQAKQQEKLKQRREAAAERFSQRLGVDPLVPKTLTVRMRNEYADLTLKKTVISNRKKNKGKGSSAPPNDGFIDTRVLYQEDLEDAQKENGDVEKTSVKIGDFFEKVINNDVEDLEMISSPENRNEMAANVNSPEQFQPSPTAEADAEDNSEETKSKIESSFNSELSNITSNRRRDSDEVPIVQSVHADNQETLEPLYSQVTANASTDLPVTSTTAMYSQDQSSRKRKSDTMPEHNLSRDDKKSSSRRHESHKPVADEYKSQRSRGPESDSRGSRSKPEKDNEPRHSDPRRSDHRNDNSTRSKDRPERSDRLERPRNSRTQDQREPRSDKHRESAHTSNDSRSRNRNEKSSRTTENDSRPSVDERIKQARGEPEARTRPSNDSRHAATSGSSRSRPAKVPIDPKRARMDGTGKKRRSRSRSSSGSDSGSESDSSTGSSGSSSSGSSGSSSSGSSGSSSSSGED